MRARVDVTPWTVTAVYAGAAIAAGVLLPRLESRPRHNPTTPDSNARQESLLEHRVHRQPADTQAFRDLGHG